MDTLCSTAILAIPASAELVGKGANVQGESVSRPLGLREFRVLDPEGNQLIFGQPFE